VLAPQILTRTTDWPRLASAHPQGGQGSPQKFKGEHVKLGLKFRVCRPITLGVVGVTSRNFSTRRIVRQGCSSWHYFWGRPAPWNLGGQKTSKVQRDFWQLSSLIANISGTDPHIENRKKNLSTTTPPTLGEKRLWTLVHKQKSSIPACWPTQMEFFDRLYFGP